MWGFSGETWRKETLQEIGVTGRIIIKLIERSKIGGFAIGHVASSGKQDHGPSDSIKDKNFLNSQGSNTSQEQFYSTGLVIVYN